MMEVLYIVVPCYNEEEVLNETAMRLVNKFNVLIEKKCISKESKIVFVDDGSKDKTWNIISKLHTENKMILGLSLSRNYGHQKALLAGISTVKDISDAVISMDADLQDDIDAIDEMVEKFCGGCDIVYGVRTQRKTDTFFKKITAEGFYKVIHFLGAEIVFNHADYRLMSKRALNELEKFKEVNLFIRGIVPLVGFKSDVVYYDRHERFAGTSKYSLKKMLSFAFDGITSLSIKPIDMILNFGFILFLAGIIILTIGIFKSMNFLLCIIGTMSLLSGIQLAAIGIIGEYIGKTYMESKRRPRYIIREFLN